MACQAQGQQNAICFMPIEDRTAWCSPPTAHGEQVFAVYVQSGWNNVVLMIGIDIVLKPLNAVWRKTLGEPRNGPKPRVYQSQISSALPW